MVVLMNKKFQNPLKCDCPSKKKMETGSKWNQRLKTKYLEDNGKGEAEQK